MQTLLQNDSVKSPSNGEFVKSAGRVLLILEYFDRVQRPANLAEICRDLSFPLSSASHLLRSMVSLGFLHFNQDGRVYMPTSRVSFLGTWTDPKLFREGKIYELVETLVSATGKTVLLSNRAGVNSRCIFSASNGDEALPCGTVGTMRWLHETASGLMLLGALPSNEAGKIIRRLHSELGGADAAFQTSDVFDKMVDASARGYAMERDRDNPEFAEIALAATLCDGSVHAIACFGPHDDLQRDCQLIVDEMHAIVANIDHEPLVARGDHIGVSVAHRFGGVFVSGPASPDFGVEGTVAAANSWQ